MEIAGDFEVVHKLALHLDPTHTSLLKLSGRIGSGRVTRFLQICKRDHEKI